MHNMSFHPGAPGKTQRRGTAMKLIDIHTHIYPDKIARKAADSVRDFYQIDGSLQMDGTRERGNGCRGHKRI